MMRVSPQFLGWPSVARLVRSPDTSTGFDQSGLRDDTVTKVRRSVLGFGEVVMRQKEG